MMRQYELVERVQKYDPTADENLLNRAYVYAMKAHGQQKRASGAPYFSHPLEVAAILTDLKLDDATIVTALLHDVIEDTDATRAEIDQLFGAEIGALVDGLTKIKRLDLISKQAEQAENFRKLLLAISSDIRVLLVKLADRLHNMRTLEHMKPESRRRSSEETLEIYAPLAGRMGMQALRDELEEHAFRWLYPEAYKTVTEKLTELRTKNEGIVDEIAKALSRKLVEVGIKAEVSGREKKPYSIWSKMENRQISLEQLSDIYAFRVVVDTIDDCYRVLGVAHTTWRTVPGRFKDYVSTPKQNNYQSIHTTVVGPRHQRVELQIRTRAMHSIAEYGVAAHAFYKDSHKLNGGERHAKDVAEFDKENGPYVWLRRLVETLLEGANPEEFLEHTKLELFQDQVFCFSPKGRLIALPRGSDAARFCLCRPHGHRQCRSRRLRERPSCAHRHAPEKRRRGRDPDIEDPHAACCMGELGGDRSRPRGNPPRGARRDPPPVRRAWPPPADGFPRALGRGLCRRSGEEGAAAFLAEDGRRRALRRGAKRDQDRRRRARDRTRVGSDARARGSRAACVAGSWQVAKRVAQSVAGRRPQISGR